MRSIFGWSYPPGCSGPPDDGPIMCQLCGKDAEIDAAKGGCDCKPCLSCDTVGCIDHIPTRELHAMQERHSNVAYGMLQELKKRYEKKPTICPHCKKPLTFEESNSQERMPYHSTCEEILRNQEEQI